MHLSSGSLQLNISCYPTHAHPHPHFHPFPHPYPYPHHHPHRDLLTGDPLGRELVHLGAR